MTRVRVFISPKKNCEIGEGDEVKKDEPDQREGEFEIHGRIGTEGDDGMIGEKEDGGEGDEQGKIDCAEEFIRHFGRPWGEGRQKV